MTQPFTEIVRYSKPVIYRTIGYKIYAPAVKHMHESEARIKIISAPARTSKSYSTAADALPDVFPEFGILDGTPYPIPSSNVDNTKNIWIVAPRFSLAKEFDYLFTWLVEKRQKYGWAYDIERAQKAPEQGHMNIVLAFGNDPAGGPVKTHITVKSEMTEKSIQADEVAVALLSEAGDLDSSVWQKYLSTRSKRSLWATTPKPHADWIRAEIEEAKANPLLRVEHFEYDGRCNPTYDWDRFWIEHMKAESRQSSIAKTRPPHMKAPPGRENGHDCWRLGDECAASRDPHFGEQFMGRWTYAESRVLPFRWQGSGDRISHILDLEPAWISHADKYVSIDYGYTDPACAVFFSVDADGTVVCFDEIYEKGLEPDRFCAKIKDRAQSRGYKVKRYFADPQKPEVMRYLQRLHLPVMKVDPKRQRDRQTGFMVLQDLLSDDPMLGRPKLFLMRQCQNGIREMRTLHRKDSHRGNEFEGAAIVGDDHFVDALRYGLTTFPAGVSQADRMKNESRTNLFELARENAKRVVQKQHPQMVGAGQLGMR